MNAPASPHAEIRDTARAFVNRAFWGLQAGDVDVLSAFLGAFAAAILEAAAEQRREEAAAASPQPPPWEPPASTQEAIEAWRRQLQPDMAAVLLRLQDGADIAESCAAKWPEAHGAHLDEARAYRAAIALLRTLESPR